MCDKVPNEKKIFETEDSFKVLDMARCFITEGHNVRIEVINRAPIVCNNNLYVIYLEVEDV